MSYRTILAHMTDVRRQGSVLGAAAAAARLNDAHLAGLCVLPSVVVMPGSDSGAAAIIEEHRAAYRAEMAKLRSHFEEATRGQLFQSEWREVDSGFAEAIGVLVEHGRSADLIVASQSDPEWSYSSQLDAPERLVMESGRPVLIIPRSGTYAEPIKRVVVAWNGKREAARAVFDALPFLKQASEVIVLWVDPRADSDVAGDLPGIDVCQALARHGVKCEATQNMRPAVDVGDALLSAVKTNGAELLVMGCYGHSRLREFVFGGATRHVLRHMTVPVLMSH